MRKKTAAAWALSAIATALIVYFSLKDAAFARKWQSRGTYYFMSLLFFTWLYSLLRLLASEGFRPAAFLKENWKGIAFAFFLASLTFVSLRPALRVLSDETNVLSVSRSMVYDKTSDNVTQGLYYYSNFNREKMNFGTEKHAFLFAYLTHLVHVALGYRPDNVFVVNFFALFFMLAALYMIFAKRFGLLWTFSCMVLVLAQPIVTQSATSGGLDTLSFLFGVLSFYALSRFMEAPSAGRLFYLWSTLIMFVNTRQESVLAFAIVGAGLVFFGYVRWEWLLEGPGYALTPFLFMPTYFQRITVTDTFEQPKNMKPFSLTNFENNWKGFQKGFTDFSFFIPYAVVLNILGVAFALYCLGLMLSSHPLYLEFKKERRRIHLACITGAWIVIQWFLLTSYHMGKYDHPSSARYFMTISAVFSIFAALLLRRVPLFRKYPSYLLVVSAFTFIVYHPLSIENRFSNAQKQPRKYAYTVDYLKAHASKNSLIVVDRPGQYIVHNWGAVNFDNANRNKKSILNNFKRHLFEELWVIQDVSYADGLPTKDTRLDPDYKIEEMADLQNTGGDFIRISKGVYTWESAANAPAKQPAKPAAKPGATAAAPEKKTETSPSSEAKTETASATDKKTAH